MRKAVLALAAMLALVGAASAQTSDVWNTSDTVVSPDTIYETEAFTADNLSELTADVALDTNETLTATLYGYNDTEETANQSFDLSDGSNNKSIQSFSENTTTYLLKFNATVGDVTILDAGITGDNIDSTPSSVAPSTGGLLTGSFFEGIPVVSQVVSAVSNAVNSFVGWFSNAWAA